MTAAPGDGARPTRARRSRQPTLRVATLNIWGRAADWSARLRALRDCWPRIDADVLLLQEVERQHTASQAGAVAEALGLSVAATVDGHTHREVDEGLAVLSRAPVERTSSSPLPPSTPPRRALVADLVLRGTHRPHRRTGRGLTVLHTANRPPRGRPRR